MKLKHDLYYANANSYTKFQINISKDCREKSGKLNFSKRAIIPVKVGQAWQNSNMNFIMSMPMHIPKDCREKSEKQNLSKGQ